MSDRTTATRGRARSRTETSKPEAVESSAPAEQDTHGHETHGQGPSLPVLVPALHMRHVPLPRLGVGHVPVPRVYLPASEEIRRRLPDRNTNRWLWYGGLAGLAALGVIEWPIAGVVAAGTYIAEHRAEHAIAEQLAQREPAATDR